MSDEQETPWWKRAWPAVVAFVLGALAALASVLGKSYLAGKAMKDAQAKDNATLKERLEDKDKMTEADLARVESQKQADLEKATKEHEDRLRDNDLRAKERAERNERDPDSLVRDLFDTLDRAERRDK